MIIPFSSARKPNAILKNWLRFRKRMIDSSIKPPREVEGMTSWQPELFNTTVLLPCLKVPPEHIGTVKQFTEKFILKMIKLKPTQEGTDSDHKLVLLDPSKVSKFKDLQEVEASLAKLEIVQDSFVVRSFPLSTANWTPSDLVRAVLPPDCESVSGYSLVGHILHLNLKACHQPFKAVIGPAFLGTANVRSVVNKADTIDSTYRNFSLELLAGEPDYLVTVKENGCTYQFDFSKVYWNPRLSAEHERIVSLLNSDSLLCDACSGVGPFSVPAAKKCKVLANDLNPVSFKWLLANKDKNKLKDEKIKCHNMDAREFLSTVVKEKIVEVWTTNEDEIDNVHIVMNLPALAVTFLDVFKGLFSDRVELRSTARVLPTVHVHVYGFSKEEDDKLDMQRQCENYLGFVFTSDNPVTVTFVRKVAPNKNMLRASFSLPHSLLFDSPNEINGISSKRERQPSDEDNGNNKKR